MNSSDFLFEKENKCFGKENDFLMIRIAMQDKLNIKAIATAEGFDDLSSFVRFKLLNSNIDLKLNKILQILKSEGKMQFDKDATGQFYLIPVEDFEEARQTFFELQEILNEPISEENKMEGNENFLIN